MMLSRRQQSRAGQRSKEDGPYPKQSLLGTFSDYFFSCLILAVKSLFASALLALFVEWIGLTFFWSDMGWHHSRTMFDQEIAYLQHDFAANMLGFSPANTIKALAASLYGVLLRFSGAEAAMMYIGGSLGLSDYVVSIPFVLGLFLVRFFVLIFSLPAFLLFALVGASTGFTLRDIRRWSGGREYGRVYHRAKHVLPFACMLCWALYLTWPVAVHPNLVILPCAIVLGLNVMLATATYKKYV